MTRFALEALRPFVAKAILNLQRPGLRAGCIDQTDNLPVGRIVRALRYATGDASRLEIRIGHSRTPNPLSK